MTAITTTTPFGVASLTGFNQDDQRVIVICAQGRFLIPSPDATLATTSLELCELQPAPDFVDAYFDDPATSSLKYEGQSAYRRPLCDVYLLGQACAPNASPVSQVSVELCVGDILQRRAIVTGERRWERRGDQLAPSAPAPFVSLPLRYEQCFGGTPRAGASRVDAACRKNPVGRGAYEDEQAAEGQPLPSVEDPSHQIQSFADQPEPHGFGPLARHWAPRVDYAGTYDDAWREQRAPCWPRDFDERFFQAAAPGMAIAEPRGGELVTASGVSPEGAFSFALPVVRLEAMCVSSQGSQSARLMLDGVCIDTEQRVLTLVWRTAVLCPVSRSFDECLVQTLP